MLKKLLCEARFTIQLTTKEPLLIKSGEPVLLNGQQWAIFFKAINPATGKQSPCIPGSSLKGVIRSYTEKILRSFNPEYSCDPLAESDERSMKESCSTRIEKLKKDDASFKAFHVFPQLCFVCQLFGSTSYAGRVEIEDAYPRSAFEEISQVGLPIDRVTGGVTFKGLSGMMHKRKSLQGTDFIAQIVIRNFELWEIGLLALTLRDLNKGLVKIGSGARAGYGKIDCKVNGFQIHYSRPAYRIPRLLGASELRLVSQTGERINFEKYLKLEKQVTSSDDPLSFWIVFNWVDREQEIESVFEQCVVNHLVPKLTGRLEKE